MDNIIVMDTQMEDLARVSGDLHKICNELIQKIETQKQKNREYVMKHYNLHKEQILPKQRERNKKNYDKNKEEIKAKKKEYYEKNKEKILAKRKEKKNLAKIEN